MISDSFYPPDDTIHFSRMGWDFNIMPECFSKETVSLQAWVNQRLVHLHSLKNVSLPRVTHLHLRPFMHKKKQSNYILTHFTGTQLSFYLRKSSKCLTRARRFLSGICIFPRISGSFTGTEARDWAWKYLAEVSPDVIHVERTSQSKMSRGTNQRAVRGVVLRTGRRAEEAGRSGGSYRASASNLGPEEKFQQKFELSRTYHFKKQSELSTFTSVCLFYVR